MNRRIRAILMLLSALTQVSYANHLAITHPIPIDEIVDFKKYPISVQLIIMQALTLTQKNLTYLYGSADPAEGGMDCSGTIYYLLKLNHMDNVPRTSRGIYQWAVERGKFYPVTLQDFTSPEFSHLKPGDLLFWKGTYETIPNASISHVMMYLGENKKNQPMMFGASDGRTYQGQAQWGVSVFDFKLPKMTSAARFVGYGCIPNLTCEAK